MADVVFLQQANGIVVVERPSQGLIAITTQGGSFSTLTLTAPTEITVNGSPLTGSGTIGLAWKQETARYIFAAPTTDGVPSFRALVAADVSDLSSASITFTNKTFDLFSNTLTGTTAQFNAALSDNDFATLAGTETLTNKAIQPRVVTIADGASITVNADTTDFATQANTQAVGTLTINAPTGTPVNRQRFRLDINSVNVQTFSFNAVFLGSLQLTLPASSTGSSKTDMMLFEYSSGTTKWRLIAENFGF